MEEMVVEVVTVAVDEVVVLVVVVPVNVEVRVAVSEVVVAVRVVVVSEVVVIDVVVAVVVGKQSRPPMTSVSLAGIILDVLSCRWHPPSGNHTNVRHAATLAHRIWQSSAVIVLVRESPCPAISKGVNVKPFL